MNIDQIVNRIQSGASQTIVTDKATAKKISSALLNKGWWFLLNHIESYYYITTSDMVDLNWYIKREYKFELEQ